MKHLEKLLATTAILAFAAVSAQAADKGAAKDAEWTDAPCIVADKELPRADDGSCDDGVLATLRAYSYEYQVKKLDEDGNLVLDEETKQPVMETHVETFKLMATLLEEAGLGETVTNGKVTVFAAPDSVLAAVADDIRAALQDETLQEDAFRVIATHVVDEPLERSWFNASNGRVWTMAGDWRSGAKPIAFHDLTNDAPLRINNVAVGNADIRASNGVIHVVETPLTRMTQTLAKAE